jgi:hypothetical protein
MNRMVKLNINNHVRIGGEAMSPCPCLLLTNLIPSASSASTLRDATSTVRWLPGILRKFLHAATTSWTSHPDFIFGVGPSASITNCSAFSCSDHFSLATRVLYSELFSFLGRSTSSKKSLASDFLDRAAAVAASDPGSGLSFLVHRVGTGQQVS